MILGQCASTQKQIKDSIPFSQGVSARIFYRPPLAEDAIFLVFQAACKIYRCHAPCNGLLDQFFEFLSSFHDDLYHHLSNHWAIFHSLNVIFIYLSYWKLEAKFHVLSSLCILIICNMPSLHHPLHSFNLFLFLWKFNSFFLCSAQPVYPFLCLNCIYCDSDLQLHH